MSFYFRVKSEINYPLVFTLYIFIFRASSKEQEKKKEKEEKKRLDQEKKEQKEKEKKEQEIRKRFKVRNLPSRLCKWTSHYLALCNLNTHCKQYHYILAWIFQRVGSKSLSHTIALLLSENKY